MLTVEELLNKKEIRFHAKGSDFLVNCINPEHADRNPSMRIDQITGIFNCFSCGFKGNLFIYYGEKANKTQLRKELLKKKIKQKQAESVGLTIPKEAASYEGSWRDISPETYKHFGAFKHHDDEFRGRIVFPIQALNGKIVAFIGRHTTGETPKYYIFPEKAKLPLFPHVEPMYGHVILVEGIYDVLNLWDKGLKNAMCCFGVNNVNEDKLRLLKMRAVDSIDCFLDPDEAGQAGAAKIEALCNETDLNYRNIKLKSGDDPGSLSMSQVSKLKEKLYGEYSDSRS